VGGTVTRTIALASVALALTGSSAQAQEAWRQDVKAWAATWKQDASKNLLVGVPKDGSGAGAYYPFMKRLRDALCGALASRGFRVNPSNVGELDAYVNASLTFRVSASGLVLDAKLRSSGGDLLQSPSLSIASARLPGGWDRRSLRDIASELTGKLLRENVGKQLTMVLGDFSGGEKEEDGLVSPVSLELKEFLLESLGKAPAVNLITGKKRSLELKMHRLEGRFSVVGPKVLFRLRLMKPDGETLQTNVTATWPKAQVPPSLGLFPENRVVAAKQVEETPVPVLPKARPPSPQAATTTGGVRVLAWLNKESGVYRNKDMLLVNLRPAQDCYARVYYIQSDGTVFQIFPNAQGDQGQLKANRTHQIGGPDSPVELEINDSTLGQEFIKVFASTDPIDDSALPKEFFADYGIFAMGGGYAALKRGIKTRGLSARAKAQTLKPAAELKLLVAGPR
jgi:hypothetical protein